MTIQPVYVAVQSWIGGHYDLARRWLLHRPARVMFPLGLALGGSVGAVALLGLGGWWGIGLCILLLGLAVPLGLGAEPVMRRLPGTFDGSRVEIPVGQEVLPTVLLPEDDLIVPEPVPRVVEDIPGLLEMVELPGGTCRMGSADADGQAYEDEKPQHEVTVSAFAIGRHSVTRQLYREMMTDIPRRWARDAEDDLLPANEVSWLDAIAFCNALSERQGLTACYQMDNNTVTWNHRADGYRLPTEAEWEYAVRAGTETRWFCGEEPTALARYAWFDESVSGRVHPVGGKAPNPWGLYDMVGNVWEWCWDWYGDYAVAGVSDPTGPDHGTSRVQRGGAFGYGARRLRSAYRYSYEPEDRHDAIGFRVVRRPRRPL